MATTCNFGQIPDIRFTTLCCKGRIVIDENCDLFVNSAFIDSNLDIENSFVLPATTIDARNGTLDFTDAKIIGFNANIMGNFTGNLIGNIIDDQVDGNLLGNIFGNINGEILGNIEGNVLGNINAPMLTANVIIAKEINTMFANINILTANTLQGNICVAPGSAIVFKPGSEMNGNICIPAGANITFKEGSNVNIDTAFGTQANGDILVQIGGITQPFPKGNNNQVVQANGNVLEWTSNINVDIICATGNIKGNFSGNITSIDNTFDNITANIVMVTGQVIANVVLTDKIFGNLCGNVLGNCIIMDGDVKAITPLLEVCKELDITVGGGGALSTSSLALSGIIIFETANATWTVTTTQVIIMGNIKLCGGNVLSDLYENKTGNVTIDASVPKANAEGIIVSDSITFANGTIITQDSMTSNINFLGQDVVFSTESIVKVQECLIVDNIRKKDTGNLVIDVANATANVGNITVLEGDLIIENGNLIFPGNLCAPACFLADQIQSGAEVLEFTSQGPSIPILVFETIGSSDPFAWVSFEIKTVPLLVSRIHLVGGFKSGGLPLDPIRMRNIAIFKGLPINPDIGIKLNDKNGGAPFYDWPAADIPFVDYSTENLVLEPGIYSLFLFWDSAVFGNEFISWDGHLPKTHADPVTSRAFTGTPRSTFTLWIEVYGFPLLPVNKYIAQQLQLNPVILFDGVPPGGVTEPIINPDSFINQPLGPFQTNIWQSFSLAEISVIKQVFWPTSVGATPFNGLFIFPQVGVQSADMRIDIHEGIGIAGNIIATTKTNIFGITILDPLAIKPSVLFTLPPTTVDPGDYTLSLTVDSSTGGTFMVVGFTSMAGPPSSQAGNVFNVQVLGLADPDPYTLCLPAFGNANASVLACNTIIEQNVVVCGDMTANLITDKLGGPATIFAFGQFGLSFAGFPSGQVIPVGFFFNVPIASTEFALDVASAGTFAVIQRTGVYRVQVIIEYLYTQILSAEFRTVTRLFFNGIPIVPDSFRSVTDDPDPINFGQRHRTNMTVLGFFGVGDTIEIRTSDNAPFPPLLTVGLSPKTGIGTLTITQVA